MPTIEITDTENAGEARWGLTLRDDQGTAIFRSMTPLVSAVASATAKALIHKGPDAPTLEKNPEDPGLPAWFIEKDDAAWTARLTLVPETAFDLLLKPEDAQDDPKAAELALNRVKADLAKAEIKWVPPDADPAYEHKASDVTPTKGHKGS